MDAKKNEIYTLIKEENYSEIAIHPDATFQQKSIALIKINKFKEALKYCENNTFEMAYCFYKIGKYKSALKTARTKAGDAWGTLRSQIYYKLNRHAEAAKEIEQLKSNEIKGPLLVNYAANVALLNTEEKKKLGKETKSPEIEAILQKTKNEEIDVQAEVLYNISFLYLSDRRKMLNKLKEIDTPDRDHRNLVNAQIYNIQDKQKEISSSILTKSNRSIHRYNIEGIEFPGFLDSIKQFQEDTYYQNKIKQYSRTKDVLEICNLVDELKQNNTKPAIKLISKLSRKNSLRLQKMLKDESLLTRGLQRIILKKEV